MARKSSGDGPRSKVGRAMEEGMSGMLPHSRMPAKNTVTARGEQPMPPAMPVKHKGRKAKGRKAKRSKR